jgi:serine/threonine protein kinase/alpha-tubulin suppressor-like RCC1 family protein
MSGDPTAAALSLLAYDYEIVRELGRGGTALVYLAHERATGRDVAIKLIRAKYVEDEETLARFAREARYVGQLHHPNVVALRSVVELDELGLALVMDHVRGQTLKQMIQEHGPASPTQAESVLRDIGHALGAAHAMGIVHRDVKPENIFVDGDGRALLADFGVARSMSSDTQLTMSGIAIGTPAYMAPEQIDGVTLDGRGDIYSLGLVGWEMLTGKRPWEGSSLYAVIYQQKHEQLPDVRDIRSDVPDRLAEVIAGAIEKDRGARWQSADELIAALDGNGPARSPRARPVVVGETRRFVRPSPSAPAEAEGAVTSPKPLQQLLTEIAASDEFANQKPWLTRRRIAVGSAVAAGLLLMGFFYANSSSPTSVFGRSTGEVVTGVQAGSPRPAASTLPATLPIDSSARFAPADSATSISPIAPTPGVAQSSAEPSLALTQRYAESGLGRDVPRDTAEAAADTATKATTKALASNDTARSAPDPSATRSPAATVNEPPPAPIRPAAPSARITIAAGGAHTCLVMATGRVFCWGGNDRGQLGTGATARLASPSAVATDLRFASLAPGLSHSCAVTAGGAAWCWGENDHGQLGDRSFALRLQPVPVADNHAFRAIAAGAAHTCGLDGAGQAWCWGAASRGQLGAGDAGSNDSATPVAVATDRRFVALAAGWSFSCALDSSGSAMCWGENTSGQLGDGTRENRQKPTPVRANASFTTIAAGSGHACGLTAAGEAYCWGRNSRGQLGDGTTADQTTPVRVRTTARFVAISAGAVHTCAVTGDGAAYCWGQNSYGQLGDGGTSDRVQPVAVTGDHAFASVRAFGSHTCGATPSGEAFCWGYNLDGQLGDGSRTNRTRPVYVEPPNRQ